MSTNKMSRSRQGSQKVSIIPGMSIKKRAMQLQQRASTAALTLGFDNLLGGTSGKAETVKRLTDDSESDSEQEYTGTYFVRKKKKQKGAWIADNFAKKDCIKYCPKPNAPKKVCYCGRTKRQHNRDAQNAETADSEQDPRTAIKDLIKECPTDAYGEIQFGQAEGINNSAKYVRLSDNTDSTVILELLMYYWNLPRPRLVLSITGGGRSFKLNKQDQDTFSRGIQKAAQTTDAWILTAGFNTGVPKIVGQTMKESQTLKWLSQGSNAEDQGLNCIGIAPWGYVSGSDQLVGKNNKGCYPARYKLSNIIVKNKPVPLNPNHTHFLFIDNGLRNEPAYGGEIVMRSQIEGAIQAPTTANGLGLPVVLLVLEGGVDTILNVKSSIAQGIPTVLCDGTGRAADILAYAHHHSKECQDGVRRVKDANIPFLEEKMRISFGLEPGTEVMNKMLQNINFCVRDEQLITVFEMDEGENSDLDLAILTALLKGQATTKFYQLSLALSWNRVDVAHEYICTDEVIWPPGSLDSFLTQAISANQVGFVELFLEQGIVMKDYLTVSKLRGLYNTCEMDHNFRKLLVRIRGGRLSDIIYLNDVRHVLQRLLGELEENLYAFDRRHTCHNRETLAFAILSTTLTGVDLVQKSYQEYLRSERKKVTTGSSSLTMAELANPGMHFSRPFSELFLWAVLTNRMKLAEFFWQQTENPIVAAIIASCIVRKMAARVEEPNEKTEHQENAKKFEELATGVLDKCYETDNTLAQMVLDAPNDYVGKKTVLSMAAEAEDKKFISHACCQTLLTNIWNSGIRSGGWKVVVGILCPVFILTNVKFFPADDGYELRPLKRLKVFYTAPVARFWSATISYICLVLLYSYVLIDNFGSGPTLVELVLTVWILVLVIEELRQALLNGDDDETYKQRIMNWMTSEWNVLDGVFLLCSLLGIILHYMDNMFKTSHGFFAVGCFLLYTRALRTSAISPILGPLLVMIRKMVKEMFGFLFILGVFLLGYGVANEALAHPHSPFKANKITAIIYRPYFTIYGELFLEADEGPDHGPDHSENHPLLPVMLAIYLLLGNVLLLNLLIAIFSAVFEEVQENSVEIWKFELYHLVMESSELPLLPAPFVIFEHFYYLFTWLLQKCRRRCCKKKGKVKPKYSKKQKRMLKMFEKECAADFRKTRAEQERDEIPERIKRLDKKMETLNKQYEVMSMEVTKQLQNLNKNLSAGIHHTPDLLVDSQDQMATPQGQMVTLQGQMMTSQGQMVTSQGQMMTSQGQMATSQGQMMTSQGQMVTSQGQKVNLQGHIQQGQYLPGTDKPYELPLDKVKEHDTISQTSSIISSDSLASQGKKKKRRKRTAKVTPEGNPDEESTKWANKQPGVPMPTSVTPGPLQTRLSNVQIHMAPSTTTMSSNSEIHDMPSHPSSKPSDNNQENISDSRQGRSTDRIGSGIMNRSSITAEQLLYMNALLDDSSADITTPDTKAQNLTNEASITSDHLTHESPNAGNNENPQKGQDSVAYDPANPPTETGPARPHIGSTNSADPNPFSVVNISQVARAGQNETSNLVSNTITPVTTTETACPSPDLLQSAFTAGAPNVESEQPVDVKPSGESTETSSKHRDKRMSFSYMDEVQQSGSTPNALSSIPYDPEGEKVAHVSDKAPKSDEKAPTSDQKAPKLEEKAAKLDEKALTSDEKAPNSDAESQHKHDPDFCGAIEKAPHSSDTAPKKRRPKRLPMTVDEFLNSSIVEM